MTAVQRAVHRAIKEHGTLKNAAAALGIAIGYLCELKGGKRPGPKALRVLGLEKRVIYRPIRNGHGRRAAT